MDFIEQKLIDPVTRGDPESPLRVSHEGYETGGRRLGALRLPTVAVQEGGYHLDTLGGLVAVTLRGLATA